MSTPDQPGTRSGDEAVRKAEERAASTRDRNIPEFDDLPSTPDTANLRLGPNLNDACLSLLPLVGVWRGDGVAEHPSLDEPYQYRQQVTFAHDGRPFLYYEARSWLLDSDGELIGPGAREVGWWRPQPDDTIELLLAHSGGVMELFYGRQRNQTSWELTTDTVLRTASAEEVSSAHRLYGIVEDGDLAYVEERSLAGQPPKPHISARLRRVVG
ncbi:FABP family protein [Actinoalloteichus spitiensis]|uniref:FABP family protein n=1 Tax=Actinoalloteichus spitiensis TaxID=252394 RepID=UPI00036F63F4|nr:FABP family protein [Actinoalloteichus spitiensis]